jgi:LysR family glycine cleavage system transcriptional activator
MSSIPDKGPDQGEGELPSLTALTAFEATLRHSSFTGAAKELCRTQGAVSRQVALLETHIGRELFHREHPRLRPTRAAVEFGAKVKMLLDRLRAAVADVRESGPTTDVLHLALLPTFGTTWLIPRIPSFLEKHPDISVQLTTSLRAFDFDSGDIDAAIHYGSATWPGGRMERLMEEEVVAVCAPSLAGRAATAEDLAKETLLQLVSRPNAWKQWLEAHGVEAPDARRGPRFEHHMMALEAARAGLGYALLPDFVADPLLASGDIVEAAPPSRFATMRSYWLVYPERSLELPALNAFRDWLRRAIRADRGGTTSSAG